MQTAHGNSLEPERRNNQNSVRRLRQDDPVGNHGNGVRNLSDLRGKRTTFKLWVTRVAKGS